MKKMWYIYAMEYYSHKKSEIMPFATSWEEMIKLSEISHTKTNIL